METDKRYFVAGLFIIVLVIGTAFAFMWLAGADRRDDVTYRIPFKETVSGLVRGEIVKYHGVDVGTVKSMALDENDPRIVDVMVSLRKDAPIKTDTKATLKLKGITGSLFIELTGGTPKAERLVAVTAEGQTPVIASEKSSLTNAVDQLPKVIEKFGVIVDQARGVLKDVGDFTKKVKENPSLLLRRPKEPDKPAETPAVRKPR